MNLEQDAAAFRETARRLHEEMGRVVVGYQETIDQLLVCLIARGHALLEGVPGTGKTLFVRTLAEVMDLSFRRIQFTPDLMPADITGTHILEVGEEGRRFRFHEGPIFGNIILADEINRATPKTQSALLEAMQEESVTAGGERHALPDPFLVFATQNPIEMEGTYPLPEAQLDRFTFKLHIPSPDARQLEEILKRTTGPGAGKPHKVLGIDEVRLYRQLVRNVHLPEPVLGYVVRVVQATHPDGEAAGQRVDSAARYVRFGASPRGGQALILGAKVRALLNGRLHVSFADVRAVMLPSLRHRILLNFEAEADAVTTDQIVGDILEAVAETDGKLEGLVDAVESEG